MAINLGRIGLYLAEAFGLRPRQWPQAHGHGVNPTVQLISWAMPSSLWQVALGDLVCSLAETFGLRPRQWLQTYGHGVNPTVYMEFSHVNGQRDQASLSVYMGSSM